MRAGAMRQRLQLQTWVAVADGMGGQTGTWTTTTSVWAQVDPLTGAERLQAAQMTSVITHDITIRYRTGVLPKMRLVRPLGGQVFEIHAVINTDERNRQLQLLCSEVQTTGA